MKKIKITIGILVALIIITSIILFISEGRITGESIIGKEKIKIGILIPLTGSNAAIGEDIRNSILLALEEIKNIEIEPIIEDSKCKPAEGVTGIKKLIEFDDVSAIVGITCSGVANAVSPIIEENKVPTILSVASSYQPEKEKNFIFKLWPSDKERANNR